MMLSLRYADGAFAGDGFTMLPPRRCRCCAIMLFYAFDADIRAFTGLAMLPLPLFSMPCLLPPRVLSC